MKKKQSLLALFISMLFVMATLSEVAAVYGWTRTYSSWITYSDPVQYGAYVLDSTSDNHIRINASLALSVYEYRIDPSTGTPYVDFRLAFSFESEADSPYAVYVDYMDFQIEKDSSGTGLDKQSVEPLISSLVPYSQGKGLHTPTNTHVTNDTQNPTDTLASRYNLAFKTLKFGIGLLGYPESQAIALGWSMLELAAGYFPLQVSDYDIASWSASDRWASCYWVGSGAGGSGSQDYYCYNTLRWWQTPDYNPSSYMRIKIRAIFQLTTVPFSKVEELGSSGWYELGPIYLTINHKSTGGGGCPLLSVYNGQEYIDEGLLDIHNPEGIDCIVNHTLCTTPSSYHGKYLMRLTEESFHFSEIDQIKLLAVLYDGSTVWLPLTSAIHSTSGNVEHALLFSDDVRAIIYGQGYNGLESSNYIDLAFGTKGLQPSDIASLQFVIEGFNSKVP